MSPWNELHKRCQELVDQQKKQLLKLGRQIVPTLTPEDMLQPNDYPELDNHPVFRYEEGLLAGLQSMHIALAALEQELRIGSGLESQ